MFFSLKKPEVTSIGFLKETFCSIRSTKIDFGQMINTLNLKLNIQHQPAVAPKGYIFKMGVSIQLNR